MQRGVEEERGSDRIRGEVNIKEWRELEGRADFNSRDVREGDVQGGEREREEREREEQI